MSAWLVFEPLVGWPYAEVARKRSPFSAKWSATRELLLAETTQLGAGQVVVELDLTRADLRQDGEIRANARLHSGRARVSFDSIHGPMRYACDLWLPNLDGSPNWWRHNVRAIALTLESLRAVDRYGAVHDGEQYSGFLAIEAGNGSGFASADDAVRWIRQQAGLVAAGRDPALRSLYRAAAKRLHPDAGGDPGDWARLDEAARLARTTGFDL